MTLTLINTVQNLPLSPRYIDLTNDQLEKRLSREENYDYQHTLSKFSKPICTFEYYSLFQFTCSCSCQVSAYLAITLRGTIILLDR